MQILWLDNVTASFRKYKVDKVTKKLFTMVALLIQHICVLGKVAKVLSVKAEDFVIDIYIIFLGVQNKKTAKEVH